MFGCLGLVGFGLPVAWAGVSGNVFEQADRVTRSGTADVRLKLSVNLWGNPAMSARQFAAAPRRTVIGASLSVTAPTGQYDGTKLINLGANRWSFKPEIGVSWPVRRLDIDGYAGVWFFSANRDFFPGGLTREQDAIVSLQGHVSYTVRPRLWVAFDSTWYSGGATRVSSGSSSLPVRNSRGGVTVSLPVATRQSIKVAYGRGVVVRTGTDFSTFSVAWQILWLSPRLSGRP
jgi:hypothetical protein